jgi:hypothetical protein
VRGKFRATMSWSAAHVAYSLIRPKSHIPNSRHDGTLPIGNFMLMMKKPKNINLKFEPVHPKNVFLASVVHGITCLLGFFIISMKFPIDRVPSCLLFGIWDFGRISE